MLLLLAGVPAAAPAARRPWRRRVQRVLSPASCDASCDARRRNVCVAPLAMRVQPPLRRDHRVPIAAADAAAAPTGDDLRRLHVGRQLRDKWRRADHDAGPVLRGRLTLGLSITSAVDGRHGGIYWSSSEAPYGSEDGSLKFNSAGTNTAFAAAPTVHLPAWRRRRRRPHRRPRRRRTRRRPRRRPPSRWRATRERPLRTGSSATAPAA